MKEGWITRKLGDCIKLKSGQNLPSKKMNHDGPFPVYGGNGTAGSHDQFNLTGSNVIIGRVGAQCGNVRHIQENIWLTDNAFFISDFIVPFHYPFLTYLLNHKNLRDYARQSAQPVVSNSSLKDVELSFPKSLSQQQQIVAILDQAFAAIDQARANVERNLQNAQELFQSRLNEIFSQRGEGWEERKLGEVCLDFQYGTSSKSTLEGNMPVLRMGNIQDGKIDWKDLKYSNDEADIEKYSLTFDDVLFNRTNSPELVGKTAIYKGGQPAIFAGYLIRIKRNESILNGDFLNYFLCSPKARNYGFSVMSSSVNQANISASKLKEYKIAFPDLEAQRTIATELDFLERKAKKLEEAFISKLSFLEKLKKSLLQKAFNGELTAQDKEPML